MSDPCDWAACKRPAYQWADGWRHCRAHLLIHRTQEHPDVLEHERSVAQCGTDSGATAHRRRGETVCDACRVAASIAGKLRHARQRDRQLEAKKQAA